MAASKWRGRLVGAKNPAVRQVSSALLPALAEKSEALDALARCKDNSMAHKHNKLEEGSLIFFRNYPSLLCPQSPGWRIDRWNMMILILPCNFLLPCKHHQNSHKARSIPEGAK